MRNGKPWNVNIHYDDRLAALVPPGAQRVLDVGCGDGFLAAQLATRVPRVVALDRDAGVLDRARERFADAEVVWVRGDATAPPYADATFDAVLSNATFHHLPDAAESLKTLAALVRPGGVLGIVGFARPGLRGLPAEAVTLAARGVANRRWGKWEHTAPIHWPPPHTYAELDAIARKTLPGGRSRRLLLGRHLLVWRRPEAS
ncbi:class I SAM-dependent methyltransferase [Luteipulveratus halotolerans]|uniref:Methyltransferase type 11 domain-containing protein n=1 Tax=Luteipulveratus halotolerans TaxID=1631356 RepID=A0A0L6CMR4_9MICO|nr:class I SAM-dependent methyltransferase [Luteipulveratus halotolerans]KNX39007.1 hypothetical protein VV01_20745 [Luteipulveratus halotolerans]